MSPGFWSPCLLPGMTDPSATARRPTSERHGFCFSESNLLGTPAGIGVPTTNDPECDDAAEQAGCGAGRVWIGQASARGRKTPPEASVWCRCLLSRPLHRGPAAGRDGNLNRSADDTALRSCLLDAQPDRRRQPKTKGIQDICRFGDALGWISARPQRIVSRPGRLGLYCLAEAGPTPSRVVQTTAAQFSGWDTRHRKSLSYSTAVAWVHAGGTVIASGVGGNGGIQGTMVIWRNRCRVAGGIHHVLPTYRGGEERCARGLNRACSRWKSGGESLVWLRSLAGGAPDPVRPAAKIAYLPRCHNSVTGIVACAANCLCNRSAHYRFCSSRIIPNLSPGLTTIVWTVSEAAWRAPVSAALMCLLHVQFRWRPKRSGVQGLWGDMPKMLHRLWDTFCIRMNFDGLHQLSTSMQRLCAVKTCVRLAWGGITLTPRPLVVGA